MAPRISDKQVAAELKEMLSPSHPGIEVEIAQHPRWQRRCVTFRWPGFAELLPEERFYRLVRMIPENYRVEKLSGAVWLELAPTETVDQFLSLPRSEDIAERERRIYKRMVQVGFFFSLSDSLGPSPEATCGGDFAKSIAILFEKGLSRDEIRDFKLVLIRNNAFCDCQVLITAHPALNGQLQAKTG